MIDNDMLQRLGKAELLDNFSGLVDQDRQNTAVLVAYIAEIDRRKLYLEQAYPSMFAFCTQRFHMSEAVAARRIRTGRATCRFPCILGMLARGEVHLTGVHLLAAHLTQENHRDVLRRAKHKTTREIEKLVVEIAPKPDVPSLIRALPVRKATMPLPTGEGIGPTLARQSAVPGSAASRARSRPVPLAPRRYKLQVTIGQETRDKLDELQALLSHQIPDGDPAEILNRALDSLLSETKKRKAAATDKPRRPRTTSKKNQNRGIPAQVRREVFARDAGQCAFEDSSGRRCPSRWQIEFHHHIPYARGGTHDADNIELRCRAHNQYEAELEYGAPFMDAARRNLRDVELVARPHQS